jgi:nucleosome binding factor SPN SPT16 subunit
MSESLEFSLPLLVQSGQNFNLNKFNVQSNSEILNDKTIYLNVATRYKDMICMASRTILVDPDKKQQEAYLIANDALDLCIKEMKAGVHIQQVYNNTKQFIASKDPKLVSKLHTNFGFGVSHSLISQNFSR